MKFLPVHVRAILYCSFALMVLFVTGCSESVPRVPVLYSDVSPPKLLWEAYNMQTNARGEFAKDGQSLDVPSDQPYRITLAVEDFESGVKSVTLGGEVQYACEKDGQVDNKQYGLQTQKTKPEPDPENQVPIRASLDYVVQFGKMGCKEFWTFGGGTLTLVGKAQNSAGGIDQRTLHVHLKKPA
jgi:hypothetical protein